MKSPNKALSGEKAFGMDATQEKLDNTVAWAKAAVADGWTWQPIYSGEVQNGKEADLDFGCIRLTKDGFAVQMYRRNQKRCGLEVATYGWGPDRLAIKLPDTYDMEKIRKATTICSNCGNVGETVRVGFAGRVCHACRKLLAPKIEFLGWDR